MSITLKRTLVFIAAFSIVTLLFWATGFNFDERGFTMTFWLFTGFWCGGWAALFPSEERT